MSKVTYKNVDGHYEVYVDGKWECSCDAGELNGVIREVEAREEMLDIVAEFETEWYKKHSSIWTDKHYNEFVEAKKKFIREKLGK